MPALRDDDKLFARLREIDRAVAALGEFQSVAPFETVVRVTADFGIYVETALTPRAAEALRAGLPLLERDGAGKPVRRIRLFDGRFTLEWPFVKHTLDKGGAA
jgi:hypothetical protein